ncbi:uncharacterized protein LOC125072615 [Vanessa atalanta]|uniref:uncharacterized protein LOC125072615 n=1 Tax=Vanessa atalanta TaxID=42275 RepID=UPI001FCDCF8D|nr:uncharacterized protein LOC125072615 [Vanessa atalanta]
MSIKSQKSLNDECSEIFEKSYSVRSDSNESLSCDEDEDSLSRELLKKLTPAVHSKLRRSFKKAKERNAARDIERRVEEVMRTAAAEEGIEFATPATRQPNTLYLDETSFVAALENIFGHHKYTTHAHQLFQALDAFGSGRVWWKQVVAKLVAAGARSTTSRCERWSPVSIGGMMKLEHCKRETIIKLVNIEREHSFCYAAVTRGGRVGVYSGELQLLSSYEDVQCLLLSASDRSLTIYDVTTLTHTPLYCITGLPNIPTCLTYNPTMNGGNESELIFGTERGDLTKVRFLQPRVSLLFMKLPDNINYYYWMELFNAPHTSYCSITNWRKVHSRSVRRVRHARDGDIVLSCSHDTSVSVRSRHALGKLADYVFKVQRGVSCFHMVPSLHMLVTGSPDGIVRLWESPQSSPFASLSIPGSPAVLDVAVVVALEIIVAYCSNCYLHIWDLYEECLLQTVKIKFPFLGVLGKRVEFGTYSIHAGPPRREEIDEDVQGILDATSSRRGSSVYRGSTGGLILMTEPAQASWDQRGLEQDPENIRFNRSELLITCCDYVCIIVLRDNHGSPLPPPGDTLRARRPSFWELPADLMSPIVPVTAKPAPPSPKLLKPVAIKQSTQDLDELLEKAGLRGILEKDFVLMQGLKHDLNKKLYEMEANKEAIRSAVTAGAPYLALRNYEPEPLPTFEDLAEECSRVMRILPGSSVIASPSGSEFSSPRNSKSFKLCKVKNST